MFSIHGISGRLLVAQVLIKIFPPEIALSHSGLVILIS